jgi:hypothetical protein
MGDCAFGDYFLASLATATTAATMREKLCSKLGKSEFGLMCFFGIGFKRYPRVPAAA